MVEEGKAQGNAPLIFGMVFPFSCHNYELRYWLASGGIDPDADIRLVVIPPPLMVDSLRAGHIHGFCVGEPWNSLAVEAGLGRIVAAKVEIWRRSSEKVLGVQAAWAERNQELLAALIRALDKAAAWCDSAENHAALARILSRECYTGAPEKVVARVLSGSLRVGLDGAERRVPDFILFHRYAANFPWTSQALWIYSQMLRWRQVQPSPDAEAEVRGIFRPDLYRGALAASAAPLPAEHVPDRIFDGRAFDPADIAGYLSGFDIPGALAAPPEVL